ncbi:MAG: 2-octaprenyl-6-methoxyphenyl hydroxylase [Piscirickettsiaceae bacterium]|nr:2-octaprenyl-6-methoxyphenyl hydroxylase [Piscirickettsiaceae bacterium]
MTKTTDYDLVIVGGGIIGASLAVALKNSPLRIAIIEAISDKSNQQPSYDDRGIALSYCSQRIYEAIGLWDKFASKSTPINNIHVSNRGHLGVTRFSAQQEHVPALGQVITAREMGQILHQEIKTQDNLVIICPAMVVNLEKFNDYVELEINNHQRYSTKLLVAADGERSTIRRLLNLGAFEHDYAQTAVIANITTERTHQNWAYERFTDTGTIALLPMSKNRCNLIWTVKSNNAIDLLNVTEYKLLEQLQNYFGYRLGKFIKASQRNSYPLRLIKSDQPIQHRIVLIGNAAHSVHPIAGQGLNLGVRDIAALADIVISKNDDCGDARLLSTYKKWRLNDQDNIIKATDILADISSNDNLILGRLRGVALNLVECLPPLKHWLANKSMGLTYKQPRLGKGISL